MSQRLSISTLILVALLVAAPLWGSGMVNTRGGGDSPFLLQRTHQMVVNLRAGSFPVRWMPDAAYGLGYPFFSYYAGLPYYLAGSLVLVGLDILTAIKLTQTLGFVAAVLAMYGWMSGVTKNRWAAWLAAVAYTVAPFHLVNVYVRGDSLSEFYAFAFYPLILWGLDGIGGARDSRSRRLPFVAVALSYAGLALTHNISFLIFTPFALLYAVMLARCAEKDRWRVLGIGLSAFGFGLLLAAWFLLPAALELEYVQLGPSTQDFFHYSRHFRALNLIQWKSTFDYSITADHTVCSPFAMGLAQAVFAALGGGALIVRRFRRRLEPLWGFVLLGFLVSTVMITPLSQVLWDHLPLLPVVQFPWRFLSVQALFAAAMTAALVPARLSQRGSLAVLIAALLAGSVLVPLHPERLYVGPDDVTVERLQLYELFTENIGTTIRYEWLPNTANPRPFTSDALIEPGIPLKPIPLEGAPLEATLVGQGPTHQEWQVRGEGGGIAFPLLYWPGWGARVDGEPVEVAPLDGSGYLTVQVPPSEHTVDLQLGRTPVRAVAETISLCALVVLVVALLRSKIRWAAIVRSLSGVALVVLLCLLLPRGSFGETDLTMDFAQMPYLHHNPDGVDFGGVARLEGYTLSAEELAPGDTLAVALNWSQIGEACAATVRLVSPAAVRHDVEPLAEATVDLQSLFSPLTLELPGDVSRGLYLLQLQVSGPSGDSLGAMMLRPVRVAHGPSLPLDAPVLVPLGQAIQLHAATVAQLDPGRLAVRLTWSAVQPIPANYAVSARLFDPDGQLRVAMDTQPGYGCLPTSMWRPGEVITDRYVLALPNDLPVGDGYHVQVLLYQASSLEPVGQAQVGGFALPLATPFQAQPTPRGFSLPALEHPIGIDFGGEVRLAGYDLERETDVLRLTLWWQAERAPAEAYTVFVHLFDPATEVVLVQSDAQPRGGAYPTSWWAGGEVVSETVTLSLMDVSQGTYRLAVGLYDQTVTRLLATTPDGERLLHDRVILPLEVDVE
jgi:hypothetical protein